MAYTRIDFVDNQTELSASNLNHLEDGIVMAMPTGTITAFCGSDAPSGWLICDGSDLDKSSYLDLFNVIGYTFGRGDDGATFNLPNLKGKVIVGVDTDQTEFDVLGETGGEKTHKLVVNEMPSHRHKTLYGNTVGGGGTGYAYSNTSGTSYQIVQSEGGDQPHNNLQPYITMNYIIKY